MSFIEKVLCSIGIHQGEWTKTSCQQSRYCIFCGKPQNLERHNWPPVVKDWGEYFKDGSCEKRVTCMDCGETKSIGIVHNWSSQWEYVMEGSCETRVTCINCGNTKSGGIQHEGVKHEDEVMFEPWRERRYATTHCKRCGENLEPPGD